MQWSALFSVGGGYKFCRHPGKHSHIHALSSYCFKSCKHLLDSCSQCFKFTGIYPNHIIIHSNPANILASSTPTIANLTVPFPPIPFWLKTPPGGPLSAVLRFLPCPTLSLPCAYHLHDGAEDEQTHACGDRTPTLLAIFFPHVW